MTEDTDKQWRARMEDERRRGKEVRRRFPEDVLTSCHVVFVLGMEAEADHRDAMEAEAAPHQPGMSLDAILSKPGDPRLDGRELEHLCGIAGSPRFGAIEGRMLLRLVRQHAALVAHFEAADAPTTGDATARDGAGHGKSPTRNPEPGENL